jgi:hypothetical protein
VTAVERVFAARLYPREAVLTAAEQFREVCPVEVLDLPKGTRAILEVPPGADDEVVGEFCNAVLAAAMELHLGGSRR